MSEMKKLGARDFEDLLQVSNNLTAHLKDDLTILKVLHTSLRGSPSRTAK